MLLSLLLAIACQSKATTVLRLILLIARLINEDGGLKMEDVE